jgi:GAF domain-containing protein
MNAKLSVPDERIADWQSVVDLMARAVGVPAGLIMRLDDPRIEVFVASRTEGNPYHPGDSEHLWDSGLYCEQVIKTQDRLLVADARTDPDWDANPDLELGMVSYLGYPLTLPDGTPFGTICVLDSRHQDYGELYLELVAKLRDLVQEQLGLIFMNQTLQDEKKRLADYIDELKTLRELIPICARCKRVRSSPDYWEAVEAYVSQRTGASFTHSLCPRCAEELYPGLLPEKN